MSEEYEEEFYEEVDGESAKLTKNNSENCTIKEASEYSDPETPMLTSTAAAKDR